MLDPDFLDESIQFHQEQTQWEFEAPLDVKAWIAQSIQQEQREMQEINFIFCSDEYLHEMNVQYLQHDDYTDVITFPYDEERVYGDVFISIDRVRENAQQYGVSPQHELLRVMIHGTLHLMGYEDTTPELKKAMSAKEDFYLQQFLKTP
jgi:rRNA maturation RNase YbeY